jgi:hypothetical protein
MLENKYNPWLEILAQTGQKTYLQNQEAFSDLKNLQTFCNTTIATGGGFAAAGMFLNPALGLVGGFVSLTITELSKPVDRLVSVMEELLKLDDIIVTPRIKTEHGTIDLLVKMPDRRRFAFALRSKLNSRIKWRKEDQNFFATTPRKGRAPRSKRWPDLLESGQNLNKSIISLNKQKSYLLGANNSELRLPVVKAIVLTSTTTVDPANDPDLFVDFGATRVLKVQSGCSMHVLEQREMIKFLEKVSK